MDQADRAALVVIATEAERQGFRVHDYLDGVWMFIAPNGDGFYFAPRNYLDVIGVLVVLKECAGLVWE